jgi:hypothetical protein
MTFNFVDLDAVTRARMLEEFESDVAGGRVYISARSVPGSNSAYFDAQRTAFASGNTDSLTRSLFSSGTIASVQSDGKKVNIADAAATLGDGQFVAYYSRAVCLQAIEEGVMVEVYRGQSTASHRAASDALIGTRIDPAIILEDLRTNSLEPWRFASVGKVNSGLAVKRS